MNTKITTTLENTSISILIENHGNTHENKPTTLTVEVCSETASHIVSLSSVPHSYPGSTSQLVTDSLGRLHFKTLQTGPATIALRSTLFHSSTSETHTTDLKPVLEAVEQEGKTMITIVVDGDMIGVQHLCCPVLHMFVEELQFGHVCNFICC